jgi:hypothetical protein
MIRARSVDLRDARRRANEILASIAHPGATGRLDRVRGQ